MTSLLNKFGLMSIAVVFALAPSRACGQTPKSILDKAGTMKTEGAKHADAVEAAQPQAPAKAATGKQGTPPPPAAGKPAPPPAASKQAPAAKQPSMPPAKASAAKGKPATPAAKGSAKQAAKVAPAGKPQASKDPFVVPLTKPEATGMDMINNPNLPSGQAGLLVSQLEVQGFVKTPNGFRAIVKGPRERVYFLKTNDKLYQARVTKITEDAIYFEETSRDPLGKELRRESSKSLPKK